MRITEYNPPPPSKSNMMPYGVDLMKNTDFAFVNLHMIGNMPSNDPTVPEILQVTVTLVLLFLYICDIRLKWKTMACGKWYML